MGECLGEDLGCCADVPDPWRAHTHKGTSAATTPQQAGGLGSEQRRFGPKATREWTREAQGYTDAIPHSQGQRKSRRWISCPRKLQK